MKLRVTLTASVLLALVATHGLAAQQPPSQGAGEMVRLADLLSEAERVHPSIKAEAELVESMRARVPQAKALPDPTLAVGWMGDIAPFVTQGGDPSSYRAISATEQFPYPGKLALKGQIAQKDVDAQQWNLEAARRLVRAEVKSAYYELWAVDQGTASTQRNRDLLERLARIAEEKYRVGMGLQQDVLRSQLEVSRVLQKLVLLLQRRNTLVAQLNSLLLRPPETPIGTLAPVEKSPLNYTLDELIERGVADYPEIRRQDELIEQNQYAINLARKEYYPDFMATYNFEQRSGMPDMHGVMVGINLPIFYRNKQRQGVLEAGASLNSSRQSREAIRTALLFQIKGQYLQARATDELLTLYTRGLVPQSSLTFESSLAPYQTGALDFQSVIANFTSVLDYEVEYYEELAAYQKALVQLEQITDVALAN